GFSRLLNYIQHTQKRSLEHLKPAEVIELKNYLSLDMYSKRNLELTETMLKNKKRGSLLWVLDETVTAMGARLLKKWIERPLLNKEQIEQRLDIVEALYEHFMERDAIRETLKSVYDLERLAGRVAFGNVNARDLIQLKISLKKIPELRNTLQQLEKQSLEQIIDDLTYPEEVVDILEKSIADRKS